jgi:hypothetical protein
VLASVLDQTQAMIVGVAHFTHQDEVRGRHASGIVRRAGEREWTVEKWKSRKKKRRAIPTFPPPRRLRDGFLTPQANLQFSTPLRTHTFQHRRGDTMWVGSTRNLRDGSESFFHATIYRFVRAHNSALSHSHRLEQLKT